MTGMQHIHKHPGTDWNLYIASFFHGWPYLVFACFRQGIEYNHLSSMAPTPAVSLFFLATFFLRLQDMDPAARNSGELSNDRPPGVTGSVKQRNKQRFVVIGSTCLRLLQDWDRADNLKARS